ncbi:hypothetical protein ACH5A2_25805 [Streptomyces collinus]
MTGSRAADHVVAGVVSASSTGRQRAEPGRGRRSCVARGVAGRGT